MKRVLSMTIALTAICLAPASAADVDKAKASFDSFAELVIGGTWTRDDDPSFKHRYRWDIKDKFIHRVGRGGALPDVGMIGIDPEAEQMTFWLFNQDGSVSKMSCIEESDGVWSFAHDGKGPDGPHRYRGRASRVDANTIKEEVIENTVNGKSEKKGEFTWNRTDNQK